MSYLPSCIGWRPTSIHPLHIVPIPAGCHFRYIWSWPRLCGWFRWIGLGRWIQAAQHTRLHDLILNGFGKATIFLTGQFCGFSRLDVTVFGVWFLLPRPIFCHNLNHYIHYFLVLLCNILEKRNKSTICNCAMLFPHPCCLCPSLSWYLFQISCNHPINILSPVTINMFLLFLKKYIRPCMITLSTVRCCPKKCIIKRLPLLLLSIVLCCAWLFWNFAVLQLSGKSYRSANLNRVYARISCGARCTIYYIVVL